MTRDETKVLIRTIKAAYPNYKPEDMTETIDLWSVMLSETDYKKASKALAKYIVTDRTGFAPSIGQLLAKGQEDEMDPLTAWALVAKAIRRSAYYAEEEFEKLPALVQKAIGSHVNLQAWSQLPPDTVHSVTQSQFISAYKSVTAREREEAAIPESVRNLIADAMPRIGAR
ncbi:MAG: hypothetical protein IKF99_00775 [Oscillospiraceae bacterium]|nr:hypothetical protein [Oscillospiraceae bacterium]